MEETVTEQQAAVLYVLCNISLKTENVPSAEKRPGVLSYSEVERGPASFSSLCPTFLICRLRLN